MRDIRVVPALKRGLGATRPVLKDRRADRPSGRVTAHRAAPSRGFSPGTTHGGGRQRFSPGTTHGGGRRRFGPGTTQGESEQEGSEQ
jgi:hypothetical protein